MILQSLHGLYDRLERDAAYQIAPPGFSVQKITFKVVLHPDGRLFAIQDARQNLDGRLLARLVRVLGTNKAPGSGLNPCFLWDNSGYMLGFKPDDEKPARTRASFEAFRSRHLAVEAEIPSPAFKAVCRFLESWHPEDAANHAVLADMSSGFGVFQLVGTDAYVHDESAILSWWKEQEETGEPPSSGQCLVTGDHGPVAVIHPKIRGIESTGSVIVGFNDSAYESYGKDQSCNAPVGIRAAFRYTTALNALLEGPMRPKHRIAIGGTVAVFWTEKPTIAEDIFARFAIHGSRAIPEEMQDEALVRKLAAFIKALRSGRKNYTDIAEDPDHTRFYMLGLAPNRARLAVRFFHVNSVTQFLDHQREHFTDIAIERRRGDDSAYPEPEFPSITQLLDQTCPIVKGKPDGDKIPPILAGPLLQSVVGGAPYPQSLYTAVLRRLHAERDVTYLKACVIKGYLNRNRGKEIAMSLDIQRTDPAYRMGRLFATLEKTQTDALGHGLNTTIRDRFYSSASATPRTVFPRLMRTYQHHLGKLDGGFKVNREKLVQEIVGALDGFPAQLDLEGQGLFAIGYYHQMRAFYTSKVAEAAVETND